MAGPQLHRRRNPTSRSAAAIEIEPGRRVPTDWDEYGPYLFERWSDRKARRAAEKARAGGVDPEANHG